MKLPAKKLGTFDAELAAGKMLIRPLRRILAAHRKSPRWKAELPSLGEPEVRSLLRRARVPKHREFASR